MNKATFGHNQTIHTRRFQHNKEKLGYCARSVQELQREHGGFFKPYRYAFIPKYTKMHR